MDIIPIILAIPGIIYGICGVGVVLCRRKDADNSILFTSSVLTFMLAVFVIYIEITS